MNITVPAMRIRQNGHTLFMFAIDGKSVQRITVIPELVHDENGVSGYQRGEIASHIKNIREYLDSDNPMLANSLIIAFDKKAPRFKPIDDGSDFGHLVITKPAMLLDGHQRSISLRECNIPEGSFPVPVVAFLAESEAEQRDQFLRINSAKPLNKSLINTLLPHIDGTLTADLEAKRLPAMLLSRLADDEDSPLRGIIKTPTNPGGWVTDGTIMDMLKESLRNDIFSRHRDDGDLDAIVVVLKQFWSAASDAFGYAWQKPGKESRLFMRAGVLSLGRLMDTMLNEMGEGRTSRAYFYRGLRVVEPHCRWTPTEEPWDLKPDGKYRWDGIESTMIGVSKLSDALCRWYRRGLKVAETSEVA